MPLFDPDTRMYTADGDALFRAIKDAIRPFFDRGDNPRDVGYVIADVAMIEAHVRVANMRRQQVPAPRQAQVINWGALEAQPQPQWLWINQVDGAQQAPVGVVEQAAIPEEEAEDVIRD